MHLALGAVQIFFAANAVLGKIALRHVGPSTVLGVRVPSAAVVFVLARWWLSRSHGWQAIPRRELFLVCGCAILGITLNQLFFFEGLSHTSAINTVVITTTIPVFAAGFAVVLGFERATLGRLIGLVLALLGALLVVLLGRSAHGAFQLSLGLGEMFLLANSACYALYLVLSRPLFQRYRTETIMAWIFVIGAITLLPFGLRSTLHELPTAPSSALWSLLGIVLGPTLGAYFLNGYALKRASSSLVAVYIYAQPPIAAVMATFLLDEHIAPATLAGAALIGTGIALVSLDAKRRR